MDGPNRQQPISANILSESATNDVLALRKIEVLLDVLNAVDQANTADAYTLKLKLINKIEDVIDAL